MASAAHVWRWFGEVAEERIAAAEVAAREAAVSGQAAAGEVAKARAAGVPVALVVMGDEGWAVQR
jgi:hypothetical protein